MKISFHTTIGISCDLSANIYESEPSIGFDLTHIKNAI